MRPKLMLAATVIAIAALSSPASRPSLAQTGSLDIAAIEQATGLKGQLIAEENVFKVTKPRTDVRIQIDQWEMPPFMGLASWAAFTPAQGSTHVMIMGDTVVFEDEVNPTMSAAFDAGLDVTALHNHFFFDEPKVYFMHIGVNTWAAFAGSDEAAVVDGDFAMLENELQPVLRAMRKEGINIVAIHRHMSHEQPRYLFLHYWGKGKAVELAQSLKRVLDTQAAVKS